MAHNSDYVLASFWELLQNSQALDPLPAILIEWICSGAGVLLKNLIFFKYFLGDSDVQSELRNTKEGLFVDRPSTPNESLSQPLCLLSEVSFGQREGRGSSLSKGRIPIF